MERSQLRQLIALRFREALAKRGVVLGEGIESEMALVGSGLDSLGFATLIVQLEDALGGDPFSMSEKLEFPRTFGELVQLYGCCVDLE